MIVSAEYHRTTGLGNKLFPWSRANIFAYQQKCKMVDPIWFAPRGAAIIRGGVKYQDLMKRFWLLNNFVRDPQNITFGTSLIRYQKFPKIYLNDLRDVVDLKLGIDNHYIFRAIASHNFSDLHLHREFICNKLTSITAPAQIRFVNQFSDKPFIGLHIRTGKDFVSKKSGKSGFFLTEIEWFINALVETRKRYGNLPALIVSDGGESQLSDIIRERNVRLVQSNTAIADILVLSKAKVLLGSGNSTFSAWGSFLGGMDTYSSIETPLTKFQIHPPAIEKVFTI